MGRTVADSVCDALGDRGVDVVFGVPGSQTIDLWESLRRASLRSVVPTSELGASFMAAGYARASGRTGVLLTIGEPGFAFALPGLAESFLGSVPVLHLATPSRAGAGRTTDAFRQSAMASLVAKAVHAPAEPSQAATAVHQAHADAAAGEPGPVVVELTPELLRLPAPRTTVPQPTPAVVDETAVERVAAALRDARRPLLLCGAGAAGGAKAVVRLAEGLGAPVLTTTSGRGVIAESHRLSVVYDIPSGDLAPVNELVARSDLVLVLGAKLSDNATHLGRLRLPAERVVRVDSSRGVFGGAYPAREEVVADAPSLAQALARRLGHELEPSQWRPDELARLRQRSVETARLPLPEPSLGGVSARRFFSDLRAVIPAETPIATDSGLHQYLTRCYLPVLAPRTLLVPADFQSMGFGIPTAIGAAVATHGPAVAIVGDGGFSINGLELLTAVREGLTVIVIVVVDGQLGLIRAQQLHRTGRAPGSSIRVADLRLAAQAIGARYLALEDGDPALLAEALAGGRTTVVELPASDTDAVRKTRIRGLAAGTARSLLGARRRG